MSTDPHATLSVPARPDLTGGRRIAVLLCHGFTGSPASMRPWGLALAERGYAVEVIRLPGHGTTWQELNRTSWADWHGEVTRAFEALRPDHDAVVVAGLSMGGAQVLQLAAERPDEVAGVIVVNPAVASRRRALRLLPVLKHLVPSLSAIGNDVKKPGADEHAYARTPLKALHATVRHWPRLIADLPKVTAPLLYLRSTVDRVVDDAGEPIILAGVSSTDVTVVRLENSYHVATIDLDFDRIVEESVAFIDRVTSRPA